MHEGFSSYEWFRDKDFLVQEYIEKQKSIAQIARDVGCSRSTVAKYLLELGIEVRKDGLPHYRKSQLAYGELIQNGHIVLHWLKFKRVLRFYTNTLIFKVYVTIWHISPRLKKLNSMK